ncbi:MAG: FmdB family zinc ribbon protein [Dehalococcoidia bacterium]
MPIYEYICASCRTRTSVFVRSINSAVEPACGSCGGRELSRAVSGFAYHKSEQARLEEAGSPQSNPTSDDYYKDPRNIGRWAEKRLDDLGVEMPDEAKKMIDAARDGEMPPAIKDI